GLPFSIALIAIPRLVHSLGTDRFGLLTLVWIVIGYFGIFDFGLGRALTNSVAHHLGRGEDRAIGPLVWTACILMMAIGCLGAIVLAGLSQWIVLSILKIPVGLRREALKSFYLFSLSIPVVIGSSAFRGVLEAYQRFSIAIAIRSPMSIYSFAAPLAVLPYSHSLVPIVAVLVIGRFVGFAVHACVCIANFPTLLPILQWRSDVVRPLLGFGGWMTVSNVIRPLMAEMDRFLVGALVSVKAVAFYATPYDLVTNLSVIPNAISAVFFPAFTTALVTDPEHARRLYRRSLWWAALIMAPITITILLTASPALKFWLGADFAAHSTAVLRILTVGIFLNSFAYIPFALIQGAGRPDWTAKLHLLELPPYLILFWILTGRFGIAGTAIAWSIRATVDMLVLIMLGHKAYRTSVLTSTSKGAGSQ
ncbi:MAG TPA: flippase, partial [Candidatus Binataceae bacterium]|nr:flippase [Candidatus Binataceae bacterium]